MPELTLISACLGGALIGGASALLLYSHRRVAGISGIAAGLLTRWSQESGWRLAFILGLVASGLLYQALGLPLPINIDASPGQLAAAGLLVGFGSRLGGGCTSGHGVCGIARLSPRSIVATLTFMLTAGVVVYLTRHVMGAA